MTFKIFEMNFSLERGARVPSAASLERFAEGGASEVARAVGESVLERTKYALSKGGKFKVGATGTAESNVFLRQTEGGDRPVVEIFEGDLTKANYFIRRGSNPGGIPPPIGNIRTWMMAKQIRVVSPEIYAGIPRMGEFDTNVPKIPLGPSKQVRYTKKGAVYKRSMDIFTEVSYRIAWTIAFEGTSKFSMGRPPYGKKYFDYPKWVMEQRYRYVKLMRKGSDGLMRALVKFALSGSREEGIDPDLAELFRYRRWK